MTIASRRFWMKVFQGERLKKKKKWRIGRLKKMLDKGCELKAESFFAQGCG